MPHGTMIQSGMPDAAHDADPIRDGHRKKLARFVSRAFGGLEFSDFERACTEAGLPPVELTQRALETGGRVRPELLRQFVTEFLIDCSKSAYGPNCAYRSEAKPVSEQIAILREIDWGREVDYVLTQEQHELIVMAGTSGDLPGWVEGLFVSVIHHTMFVNHSDDPETDFGAPIESVSKALEASLGKEGFCSGLSWSPSPGFYRRRADSAEGFRLLWESQGKPSGILLLPAQLGIRYKGRSTKEAVPRMRKMREFPLGAYEMGQILLTHPERLADWNDLEIACSGDESFSCHSDNKGDKGSFRCTPFYDFAMETEMLHLESYEYLRRAFEDAEPHRGHASAMLPVSLGRRP